MTADTFVAYMHRNKSGHNFLASITGLVLHDAGRRIADFAIEGLRAPAGALDNGRNTIMQDFLSRDHEWLFMVDDDMGFTPSALDALHQYADPVERPIVGGLCFSQGDLSRDGRSGYRWRAQPTIYYYLEQPDGGRRFQPAQHFPVSGLVRCDATGGAFLLIHRSVGVRMVERFGPAWFEKLPDAAGLPASEDLSFFMRCFEMGIPCHVATGVRTNHMKETWISELDFWERLDPPPATERVDVLVPVLHRPRNVEPFMQTLLASTGLATAWFICDRDDKIEQDEVLRCGGRVLKCDGTFAEKANYAYGKVSPAAPWVFLAGDDVQFRPGWLDHALFMADAYGAEVVGTNDLGNPRVTRGDHATHMLVRRSYVDEVGASVDGPGSLCGPYGHWFVDDELVGLAQRRGVWQMALGSVVEHMHPYWNKGVTDAVYEKGAASAEADRVLFEQRMAS